MIDHDGRGEEVRERCDDEVNYLQDTNTTYGFAACKTAGQLTTRQREYPYLRRQAVTTLTKLAHLAKGRGERILPSVAFLVTHIKNNRKRFAS